MVRKSTSPDFDDEFEYRVAPTALPKKYLLIQFCVANQGIRNDVVGDLAVSFRSCANRGSFRWSDTFAVTQPDELDDPFTRSQDDIDSTLSAVCAGLTNAFL